MNRYETRIEKPGADSIARAAALLRGGEVVAIPTETVYGLAANALDPNAVSKIFAAKGRPQDNPLIVHIAELSQLDALAKNVPRQALDLADAFWPGPLTILFSRSEKVPERVCAGLDTVGIRMPDHPVALSVIRAAGTPLAAPSANASGRPSPTTAQHVWEDMQGRIPLILDGGPTRVGVESTVLLLGDQPEVLRPGGVTPEAIQDVLQCPVKVSKHTFQEPRAEEKPKSPGMKYRHYAPKADLVLVKGTFEAFEKYAQRQETDGLWALCFTGEENRLSISSIAYGPQQDPLEQASRIFDTLRLLDEKGAKTVLVRCPEADGVGLAVYNRLLRAAAFTVIEV